MKWRQAQHFRKRIQNNDSEDDPRFWKKNGENARNTYQRPRTKEQLTEMKNTVTEMKNPQKESIAE